MSFLIFTFLITFKLQFWFATYVSLKLQGEINCKNVTRHLFINVKRTKKKKYKFLLFSSSFLLIIGLVTKNQNLHHPSEIFYHFINLTRSASKMANMSLQKRKVNN